MLTWNVVNWRDSIPPAPFSPCIIPASHSSLSRRTIFSISIDSTTFGALTGTPVFLSGAAIELDGTGGGLSPGQSSTGNTLSSNLVEMVNYPFFVKSISGIQNTFSQNNLYDSNGLSVAYFGFYDSSQFSSIFMGFSDDLTANLAFDTNSIGNDFETSHQNQTSVKRQPWEWVNNVIFRHSLSPGQGPFIMDAAGNYWFNRVQNSGNQLYFDSNIGGNFQEIAYLWAASASQVQFKLMGSALNVIGVNAGDLKVYSADGSTYWFGDPTNNWHMTNGIMTASPLAGVGSRPLCVTATGIVEAGSLAAGLVTCP